MAFDITQTYLGNTILQYIIYLLILAGSVLAAKVITWVSKTILRTFADKTKTKADDLILTLLEGPVLMSVFVVAMHFGKVVLHMSDAFLVFYGNVVAVLFMINVAWYLMRFINGLITFYLQPLTKKSKTDLDDHLLPLVRKLINFLVIVIVGIMIIDRFGYNVGSLLAGLGLGGLAFALAAQDLVSNLFGGIAILMDKPFKLGDRVKVGEVDGFVREIGLRTTRIETFGGTMMVMPNSKMVNSVAENVSAEVRRRMSFTIGVEYGTSSAKMEQGKKIIEQNLKKVKGLDHKKYAIHFVNFGSSSLDIRVQYWILLEAMTNYFGVQDQLLSGIKKDFEKAKIEFAFPTQTVHVKK